MKGGAVAADGRIEPGDMLLQVLDTHMPPFLGLEKQKEKTQKPPWLNSGSVVGRGKLSHCRAQREAEPLVTSLRLTSLRCL